MYPVIPLYDTRPVGDVWLDASRRLAQRLGSSSASQENGDKAHHAAHASRHRMHPLPWRNFKDMLQGRWKVFLATQPRSDGLDGSEWFNAAWIRLLQAGGWWAESPIPITQRRPPAPFKPALFSGSEQEYPFYFSPYPSMTLHYEGANLPWLQELPDTLTTAVWGSWVEINPAAASAHGIHQAELVRVISPYGELQAPAVFAPGIRPDLIAVPIGQGHEAYGRYAKGRGVNPLAILAPLFDKESGALATAATRVRIEATGKPGKPVLLEQVSKHAGCS